ncbi:MAG: adenosylcobinamide-GDP ribazoletransferase [Sphingomonadaceae bacterium]
MTRPAVAGPIARWFAREGAYFATAVQFLTRLPVPRLTGFEQRWLDCAAGYFPLAGLMIGAITAGVMWLAGQALPGMIPAILAVAVGMLATGAFHEDGLADTFDGLGGGHTREQKLAIMKDSRVGTYGLAALFIALTLKIASLAALPLSLAIAALLAAHAGGRIVPVIASAVLPYGGETVGAKVAPISPSAARIAFACATGLVPFALLPLWPSLLALAIGFALAAVILAWAYRAIGGHTGDVLGAAEQAFEVAVLVVLAGAAGAAATGT